MAKSLSARNFMIIFSVFLILIILPCSFAVSADDSNNDDFALDLGNILSFNIDLDFLTNLFNFDDSFVSAAESDGASGPGGDGSAPPDANGGAPDGGNGGSAPGEGESQSGSTEAKGAIVINGSETYSGELFNTSSEDTSVILVKEAAKLVLSDSTLEKLGGDVSSTEDSEFTGVNAGILVQNGELEISNTQITTSASGANALFATGENASVKASGLTIDTSKDSSRGIDVTYGGSVEADDVKINTQGEHCAALATDRGEGFITVTNSELNTNGAGSPCIYSTGNITVSDSNGLATGSSAAVIEGKNSITLTNCNLENYAYGRTTDGIDCAGVMIYQSMSGDADEGTGTFIATDTTIKVSTESSVYSTAPMFFITNTKALINLENCNLDYGSGILLNVSSNDGEWGNEGSNGGDLEFNAKNQELIGDIYVDEYSSLQINLDSSSKLEGAINSGSELAVVDIRLSSDSEWTLTDDSVVNSLVIDGDDLDKIHSNGHNIYYDASDDANSWINGTVSLSDGGKLIPLD